MSQVKAVINGIVVTENGQRKETLILENGKIKAILDKSAKVDKFYPGCEIIDAKGQYVVPGGVDAHVHFIPVGKNPQTDDFKTGSKAALAGGTTTVIDFVQPDPGENPIDAIHRCKKMAADSAVDYAFHLSITENYREELSYLREAAKEGISSFKCYTCYDGITLTLGDLRYVMEHINKYGSLIVHCEEKSIVDKMRELYPAKEGDYMPLSLTRPGIAEKIAAQDVMTIAKETGTDFCVAHTSYAGTIDIKMHEKTQGNKHFVLESCPHYALFTKDKLKGENGALFTMNPPLREKADTEAIMDAIVNEKVDILSTDHCSFSASLKKDHTTYLNVPGGIDGVQVRLPFLLSEGVIKRNMPIEAFVRLTAANPAKFYHLYPQKGTIAVGSDADLVFLDPKAPEKKFTKKDIAGGTDYSIYEGTSFAGAVTATIKGGEIVYENGKVKAEMGSGKYLPTKMVK